MAEPMTLWGLLGRILLHGQKFLLTERVQVVRNPHDENLDYELLQLPTPDGATIHCHLMLFSSYKTWRCSEGSKSSPKYARSHPRLNWDSVPANGRATVVMFHGNAMNHGDIIDLAEKFMWRGCNVVTVSYRGYGESSGTPSESGLRTDAQTKRQELMSIKQVVWGQSLGAAVAIDLVHRNPKKVAALIVENAFLSIPLLVKDFPQPFASLSFLCTQRWPSIERIQKIPKSIFDPHAWRPDADGSERASRSAFGMMDTSWDACLLRHPKKKYPIKSGSDILKSLDIVSGDVDLKNGKDRYRLFASGRHETTCRHREYWPTIGDFLDELFGPCSFAQPPHNHASVVLTGSISTKRDSLPPSTAHDDPKIAALAEAHVPMDLPPLPTPLTSPTFAPLSAVSMT
ncbi:Alpha/Beta hydrolase protein [Coprinopsis sp. MPI-PUGE-AT-0042]|nr:Alpha/Beta hydrolase protein [Coprinopsis sp. MPI-PUGE-AT-0042]